MPVTDAFPGELDASFPRSFDRQFVGADGVRLHCVRSTRRRGRPVVLLHGWPQTWYAWRHVMPLLDAAGFQVFAFDYRGAGDSDRPFDGYEKAVMAHDIRGAIRKLGLESPVLVGRDIGAMVAYAYAAQWPNEVTKLGLIDVPVPGTTVWEKAKIDPQTWHFALHQQRGIAELLVSGHERDYLHSFYKARLNKPGAVSETDLDVYTAAYRSPGAMRAGFELYRDFPNDERTFADLMHTPLAMPILAIGGEMDNGEAIEEMARELGADVRGAVVPDGGHWSPEEDPQFVADRLAEFA